MDWKEALSRLSIQEEESSSSPSPETHQNNQSETTPVPPAGKPKGKGRLRIVTEKKGRGGKTATIIFGFDENVTDEEISALAAKLKKKLSTGGSARGGEILIQGERGADVARILSEEGYSIGK